MNIEEMGKQLGAAADNKYLVGLLSFVVGALVENLRRRTRTLEYTVTHERVAIAEDHPNFGNVQVSWNNTPVTNLYASIVEIENSTTQDLENCRVRVYGSQQTQLLSQYTEISGTPFIVKFSKEFEDEIRVAATKQRFPWDIARPTVHALGEGAEEANLDECMIDFVDLLARATGSGVFFGWDVWKCSVEPGHPDFKRIFIAEDLKPVTEAESARRTADAAARAIGEISDIAMQYLEQLIAKKGNQSPRSVMVKAQ